MVVECKSNYLRMKFIEENLRSVESIQENYQVINPNLSKDQITLLKNMVIVLESDKYFDYDPSKKDGELETPREKVKDLCYFVGFLKTSIREKDDLIKALVSKQVKLEVELEHSKGTVKKLIDAFR